MQSKTIYVMPNPYCVLDAGGLLAGICQMAEERSGLAMPANQKVGAELRMVDGSYNDRQAEISEALDSGKMSSPTIPPVYSRASHVCHFSAVEPVAIVVSPVTEGFYMSRFRRNGTPPCLLSCGGPDDLQLETLAGERLDAIARFRDAYGADPPVAQWANQWELDEDVAAVGVVVAANRKADAEAADKAAKVGADALVKSDAAAKAKSDERRAKAVADAKARFNVPLLVPGADAAAKAAAKAKADADAKAKAETDATRPSRAEK